MINGHVQWIWFDSITIFIECLHASLIRIHLKTVSQDNEKRVPIAILHLINIIITDFDFVLIPSLMANFLFHSCCRTVDVVRILLLSNVLFKLIKVFCNQLIEICWIAGLLVSITPRARKRHFKAIYWMTMRQGWL